MLTVIESNSDLPSYLNTEARQITKATALLQQHLPPSAGTVHKARGVDIQGYFSRTIILTLTTGLQAVIQIRVNSLDINVCARARKALGENIVPEIRRIPDKELEEDGLKAYYLTYKPGKTWQEAQRVWKFKPELTVACSKSLGRILAHGVVADGGNTSKVVDGVVVPKLQRILQSDKEELQPFFEDVQLFLDNIDCLKVLPLCISHGDLNHLNIIVDETLGQVRGIVDWELVGDLPFGMSLGRIHDLAGGYRSQTFCMPDEFEDVERGFWSEIFGGVKDKEVRERLEANLEAVQMSVNVGVLLETLDPDNGFLNPAGLRALPMFLSYRIPQLRGEEEPYLL